MIVSWKSVVCFLAVLAFILGAYALQVPAAVQALTAIAGALATYMLQGPSKLSTGRSIFPPPNFPNPAAKFPPLASPPAIVEDEPTLVEAQAWVVHDIRNPKNP